MKLLWISLSALLLAFIGVSRSTPISNEAVPERQNTIDDLYLISEGGDLDDETFEERAIEKVKARLLRSLHLKSPPKSHAPLPILQAFDASTSSWNNIEVPSSQRNESQHMEGEMSNSNVVLNNFQNGSHCVRIRNEIQNPISNTTGALAELYLFKKEGVSKYEIREISQDPYIPPKSFYVRDQPQQAGWTRLDVSSVVKSRVSNVLEFEICSESPEKFPIEMHDNHLPFIIFQKERNVRMKRTIDCTESYDLCCKESFYISLEKIGWDNWVIQPEGYYANFCKGSCSGRWNLARGNHAQVLIKYLTKGEPKDPNSPLESEVIHCTATRYSSLNIIYVDKDGLQVIRNLPEMSVSQCACS